MNTPLFEGELVRLAMDESQVVAEAISRWGRDSEYRRLLAAEPAFPFSVKKGKAWLEKEMEKDVSGFYQFTIRTLKDGHLIGEITLDVVQWNHSDAFVGISIGEREFWDKGYGTDAMRVMLRYAFTELNLHRVSLTVFEYNKRALRSYDKTGFSVEGHARECLNRDGKRWDMIFMGILRTEWEARFRKQGTLVEKG